MKPTLSALALSSNKPDLVLIPACSSIAKPLPETRESGSTMAAITCPIPASISALAHGGVRPKWLQGSRVT